jgi:hypothetical protein
LSGLKLLKELEWLFMTIEEFLEWKDEGRRQRQRRLRMD